MPSPAQGRSSRPQGGYRGRRKPQRNFTPAAKPASDFDVAPFTGPILPFAELGLPKPILTELNKAGIAEPFPIQAATLPDALAGRDVLGRAQTGSGKTLAFGLALLTRLADGQAQPLRPRALILVPTRELAMQVSDALSPFARALGLWCRTVVGGTSFTRQITHLERGVDLLIATPGRLSDHVRQGTCLLSDVEFVALDEADQMADMGFMPQVRAILDLVRPESQKLLFSATLDRDVDKLIREYMTDPVIRSVESASANVTTMEHHVLWVSETDKSDVLDRVAARDGRTIMFVRTRHQVDRLVTRLRSIGVQAAGLHGLKTQAFRTRALEDFREGRTPVLIATDVAARGIHVDGVSLVVHIDPPATSKDYVHRAGRTARAGESGTVIMLATHNQRRSVRDLAARAGISPTMTTISPDSPELAQITGAQTPSGIPVREIERPAVRQGPRRFEDRGRNPRREHGGRRQDNRNGRSEFRGREHRNERSARSWRTDTTR